MLLSSAMGLDITCHNVCGLQESPAACEAFSGCRWAAEPGTCGPGEAGGGKSTVWIGVVLSAGG